MTTTDFAKRDQLYRSASEVLGEEEADTLMSSLPPVDWTEVATRSDIANLEAATRSDIANLETATRSDIAALETATRSDIARLEAATRSDIAALNSRFDGLEERLGNWFETFELRISASVDQKLRQQTQWVFGAVVVQAVAVIATLVR